MAAPDSMFIRQIANLLFLGTVLAASAACVFRDELSDTLYDSLASNDAAIKRKWSPESGGKFTLRPEHNDVLFVRLSPLHLGAWTSLGVPVSFDLTNLGDANDFPNIAVIMFSASGNPTRRLMFSPAEYSHDSRFGRQHIELLLQPRPGERRFTIQVFYGDRP